MEYVCHRVEDNVLPIQNQKCKLSKFIYVFNEKVADTRNTAQQEPSERNADLPWVGKTRDTLNNTIIYFLGSCTIIKLYDYNLLGKSFYYCELWE